MRILPTEIRNKLLGRFQVESRDAKPNLRVVATQSTVNTLLTEDIHTDAAASFGDVAVRQLPGEATPSLAYAICIDGGVANIYERSFPTDLESPWAWNWTLGAAADVAIEFNGEWTINAKTRCYELITEETPHIFFTDASGTLYVKKWQDEATRIPLAENVEQISSCRAWKSNLDVGVDQGLVIGYLREGSVYYRAYAEQESGALLWEEERQVTELGTGNATLALFRTNDYRLGFVTENTGQIRYVLSYRTYAGQAMPAEYADVQPRDARVWMIPPTRYYPVTMERAYVDPAFVYLMTHPLEAAFEISGVSCTVSSTYPIWIDFGVARDCNRMKFELITVPSTQIDNMVIEYSSDNVSWTAVAATRSAQVWSFPLTSARYWRIYIPSYTWTYSLQYYSLPTRDSLVTGTSFFLGKVTAGLKFVTAPAAGAAIEASFTLNYPYKTANNLLKFTASLVFTRGEGS